MADYISTLTGSQIDAALEDMASHTSEAWAVGTRDGSVVQATDPTYHNNAKYWAEMSQSASVNGNWDVRSDVWSLEIPSRGIASAWTFSVGAINSSTGGSSGSSGSYANYRRLTWGDGLYPINYPEIQIAFNAVGYEWTIWTYTSSSWSNGNRALTTGYQSTLTPVHLNVEDGDIRWSVCIRKVGSAEWTSDDDTVLANNFKVLRRGSLLKERIIWFGDSLSRSRIANETELYRFPIPTMVADNLGIVCENFAVGGAGWCGTGWSDDSDIARNRTNAIGYLKRVGDSTYYSQADPYNGYRFLGCGDWSRFNTIVLAFGTNDSGYPLGKIEDIDLDTPYADVMAWETSAQATDTSNRTIAKAIYQVIRYIRDSEAEHASGDPYVPGGKHMRIILSDPLVAYRGYDYVYSGGYTKRQMCDMYEAFAEKFGLEHISNYEAPIDLTDIYAYLPDGIHANASTYASLGLYFTNKIMGHGGTNSSEVSVTEGLEGTNILTKYGTFKSETKNGITFTWNADGSCSVSGTATALATNYIVDVRKGFPNGISPGDAFVMDYSLSGTEVVRWAVLFYDENGTNFKSIIKNATDSVVIPEGAVGFIVQIRVANGAILQSGATVNRIRLIKLYPLTMTTGNNLIVSFVDDDTTNSTYTQRYHDNCMHNGVYGTFAALAKTLGGGESPTADNLLNRQQLLDYEAEGHSVVSHCFEQNSSVYDQWHSVTSNPESYRACVASLAKTMRCLRDWGFMNYRHWITPYGVRSDGVRKIARVLNTKNLISYNNGRHNTMQDYDRYFIKRVALGENDTDTDNADKTMAIVKAEVDAAATAGKAWLIITTHFNEWGGLSWDSTLDANGYPIGYARFNEIVQYALGKGFTSKTIPEAWSFYEPILEQNAALVARVEK